MSVMINKSETSYRYAEISRRIAPWVNSTRGQAILLAVFAGVVLLSRVLFTSKILYHWDSVNFAYAIREFNLAKEQPQPPGYIVYVWLSQALNLALHDAQTVMVVISIAASLGAVIAMYALGYTLYNRRVAWAGALFLAVSPLFWFYNEIALPHSLDAFLVILIAIFLYRVSCGEQRFVLPAVILLAVAGGVRQQTLIFVGPVMLFAFRKIGLKTFVTAGVVGAVVCLAWFVPLIEANGGLWQYLQVMNDFSNRFQTTTSVFMGAGWWGLARNLTKLTYYTGYGWGVFALPAAVMSVWLLPKWRSFRLNDRQLFLALWILPALIFYLFIHMGQQGLVFVFLPALILIGAAALDRLLKARTGAFWLSALVLTVISASIFLFLPEYPFGEGRQRFLTQQTIEHSDAYFLERFELIRKNYPPDRTLILAANWHHVQFYLPEYKTLPFTLGSKWEIDEGAAINPASSGVKGTPSAFGLQNGPAKILLFDPELSGFTQNADEVQWVEATFPRGGLPDGSKIGVLALNSNDIFYILSDSFGLIKK